MTKNEKLRTDLKYGNYSNVSNVLLQNNILITTIRVHRTYYYEKQKDYTELESRS